MTTYRRVEVTKRTVRYEFDAPVDRKTLYLGIAWVEQEFKAFRDREVSYDNDFWLEPTDEGVAIVFEVETRVDKDRRTAAAERPAVGGRAEP